MKKIFLKNKPFFFGYLTGTIAFPLGFFIIVLVNIPNHHQVYGAPTISLCSSEQDKSCSMLEVDVEKGKSLLQSLNDANYYNFDVTSRTIDFSYWHCKELKGKEEQLVPLTTTTKNGNQYTCWPIPKLPSEIIPPNIEIRPRSEI